ncbi:MAG: helix-turn-helix transcriptional regulator [Clostridia bacterium]|nr:helix-turn-helix transcriptional regulator [Clostridia bacterium]
MTKVSKNIKRARSRQGLTQDALAERVHVSRQTVSSWETGRTQPDLSMLQLLCEALDVPAEELLYGEKRNTSLEPPPAYRGTVKIVFTVLASLFIAAGVLLVFLNGWESLPLSVRYGCSYLPLLLGQAYALWVLLKKRDSAAHAESGGVLWSLGLVATLAMLCVLQQIIPDYPTLALLGSVLVLPVFVLLRSMAALVIFFGGITSFACTAVDDWKLFETHPDLNAKLVVLLLFTVLTAAAFFAAKVTFPKIDPQRQRVGLWFCLFAGAAWAVGCAALLETGVFPMLLSCAIAFYALDGAGRDRPLATRFVSLPFALVLLLIASAGVLFSLPYEWKFSSLMLVGFGLLFLLPVAAAVYNRKVLRHDPLRVAQLCIFYAAMTFYTVMFLREDDADTRQMVVLQGMTLVLAALLILQGAKENGLFKINLGCLSICTLAGFLIWHADFGLWLKGVILLCFGLLLLLMNRALLSRRQKALQSPTEETEEGQVTDA